MKPPSFHHTDLRAHPDKLIILRRITRGLIKADDLIAHSNGGLRAVSLGFEVGLRINKTRVIYRA